MSSKIKSFFSNKSSKIKFDNNNNYFEIDDSASAQMWVFRILFLTQIFYGATVFFKDQELRYLGIVILIVFTIALVLSFMKSHAGSKIYLKDISYVTYQKRSSDATGSITLKNKKRRVLYHYDLSRIDDQMELFRTHGVEIREKTSWF